MAERKAEIPLSEQLQIERHRADLSSPLHSIASVLAGLTPEVKLSQVNPYVVEVTTTTWKAGALLRYLAELPEIQMIGSLTDNISSGVVEAVFLKKVDLCYRWDEETKLRVGAHRYLNHAEHLRDMRDHLNADGISLYDEELREKEKWASSRAQETLGDLKPLTQQELDELIRQAVGNEVFNLAAAQAGSPQE